MKANQLIESHKLPCGPMEISVEGVCRRKLKDHLDGLLDKLTNEIHPEGVDKNLLEMEEQVEIPETEEPEETDEEKRERMLSEGKLKAEVKHEVDKYKNEVLDPPEEEPEETEEEKKKRMIKEGKFNAEVKHAVDKHKEKLQGNSKMLQDKSGKIKKR